jgi:site-specific recombinase XerD
MKRPPEIYTRDEVQRLMASCSTRGSAGVRNRALIGLLYRTGVRINEALELRPGDVEAETQRLTVRAGKGNKHSGGPVPRVVAIDGTALSLLKPWLNRRRKLGLNGQHPIFCTLGGDKLADSYVRSLLPRLAMKAKLEKRVHAHGFRHTLAVELLQEGVDLGTISKQLGHARISTTDSYLKWLRPNLDAIGQRE